MSAPVVIKDESSGRSPSVSTNNCMGVTVDPVPPRLPLRTRPFVGFLTNAAGATDMRVVGTAAAPVSFFVQAPADGDLVLLRLVVSIVDAGATLNDFGNIGAALANGCVLQYQTSAAGTLIIDDSLTTNFDFVRLAQGQPAFGDGAGAFRASNVVGNSEGYLPSLDMTLFAPGGMFLTAGTTERLELLVRDDVTGVDQFDARAYGYVNLS